MHCQGEGRVVLDAVPIEVSGDTGRVPVVLLVPVELPVIAASDICLGGVAVAGRRDLRPDGIEATVPLGLNHGRATESQGYQSQPPCGPQMSSTHCRSFIAIVGPTSRSAGGFHSTGARS